MKSLVMNRETILQIVIFNRTNRRICLLNTKLFIENLLGNVFQIIQKPNVQKMSISTKYC